jgi:hypothetical protein
MMRGIAPLTAMGLLAFAGTGQPCDGNELRNTHVALPQSRRDRG